jgi:tripartite-type tricarboxylate transporter receptor subunit TctC
MHLSLGGVCRVFAVAAGSCVLMPPAYAQTYPAKPVRMIVGFAAGGATDTTARLVAQRLSDQLGRPVVVENRTGAGATIATERVATSAPDGYTLLMMAAADTVQPALRLKLPYDLERDFSPVSLVASGSFVLVVHRLVPARNVKELIALARAQPGKLTYGSSAVGSTPHLAGELFRLTSKVNIVHVPYKGASEFVIAAAGGQIDMGFPSITPALPLLETGKLKALAVTSVKRSALLPQVPTVSESGLPGYEVSTWYGVTAPAGVPKEIVSRLNAVIGKAVNAPEMKEALNKQGLEPRTSTPEQFAAFVKTEIAQNAKLIKAAGIQAE